MALRAHGLVAFALLAACSPTREVLRVADAGAVLDAGFVPGSAVSAGFGHTCAVSEGVLACTGSNATLALGLTDGRDRVALERVPGVEDGIDVGVGYAFSCVLRSGGRLQCFGANDRAQLGSGDLTSRSTPTQVFLPAPVVSFSAGFEHVCAILRTGALHCWGSNQEHELGQDEDAPVDRSVPVELLPGTAFIEVSAGQGHTCAIAVDGALFCMGRNTNGEVGAGAGAPNRIRTPTRVGTARYRHVAAGQNHTCAIADDGALHCWGQDADNDGHPGPLGLPGSMAHPEPARVGTDNDWTALSTDTFHTCGLRAGGELCCWGRNAEGQLGMGDMSIDADRVHVEPGTRFSSVEVGRFHTCARRDDGVLLCTGANASGELGVGDLLRRATLTPLPE